MLEIQQQSHGDGTSFNFLFYQLDIKGNNDETNEDVGKVWKCQLLNPNSFTTDILKWVLFAPVFYVFCVKNAHKLN